MIRKYSRQSILALLLLSLAFLGTGCAATLTPLEVSDRFWSAVQRNDYNSASNYVTPESRENYKNSDINQEHPDIKNVSFGKILIDKDQAWVDTTLEIDAQQPYQLPIKTKLLQVDNQWKVDLDTTMAAFSQKNSITNIMESLAEFSQIINQKMEQSIEDLQRSLPGIQEQIDEIEENLDSKIPELRLRIDEIMRQLDELMQSPQKNKGNGREI